MFDKQLTRNKRTPKIISAIGINTKGKSLHARSSEIKHKIPESIKQKPTIKMHEGRSSYPPPFHRTLSFT